MLLLCDRLFFLFILFLTPPGFYTVGRTRQPKAGKMLLLIVDFVLGRTLWTKENSFFLNPHFFCPSLFPPLAPLSPDEWKRNDCEASATIIFFLNIGGSNAACCACHLRKQLAGYGYSPLSMP